MENKKTTYIIVIVCLIFIVGCNNNNTSEPQEMTIEKLGLNLEALEDLKYEIHIDCEFVRDNQHNNTLSNNILSFINGTIDLCKTVFPELWEELNKTKVKEDE